MTDEGKEPRRFTLVDLMWASAFFATPFVAGTAAAKAHAGWMTVGFVVGGFVAGYCLAYCIWAIGGMMLMPLLWFEKWLKQMRWIEAPLFFVYTLILGAITVAGVWGIGTLTSWAAKRIL